MNDTHIGRQQSLTILDLPLCPQILAFYRQKLTNALYGLPLKGAGGSTTWGRSKSIFIMFLTEGSVSYQILFTRSKNIVPMLSDFEILKIWVITIRARTLNAISQKWTFLEIENLSSTNFEIIRPLKLGRGSFIYYVITFCLFLAPPPSVIKFGIG